MQHQRLALYLDLIRWNRPAGWLLLLSQPRVRSFIVRQQTIRHRHDCSGLLAQACDRAPQRFQEQ